MRGIEFCKERVPAGGKSGIGLSGKISIAELAQELTGGIVGEAEVGADELLIKNGSAQETSHLLLLNGIARQRQGVPVAGKHGTGGAAVQGGEKSQIALVERELQIAAAELDAVRRGNLVDSSGINTQGVERAIRFDW